MPKQVTIRLTDAAYDRLNHIAEQSMETVTGHATALVLTAVRAHVCNDRCDEEDDL